MELKYLCQLTNEELVDLFNFVLNDESMEINYVKGFNEETLGESRRDENGNEIRLYEAWYLSDAKGLNARGSFIVSDFNIKYWHGYDRKIYLQEEFEQRFRQFMTKRFQNEYLDNLFLFHYLKANEERKNLSMLLENVESQSR